MDSHEKYQSAQSIEDITARNLMLASVETEYRIETLEKRLEEAREKIARAASQPSSATYADRIEALLREWRNENSLLLQEKHAYKLLNQVAYKPA